MNNKFKTKVLIASIIAINAQTSTPVFAQSTPVMEEVFVVTSRRKEEDIQSVPMSVTGVSGKDLAELNIRDFNDLGSVVAGLNFEENSVATGISTRGVRYDVFAGNSPSVAMYINDAPTSPVTVTQFMFDVGGIEFLRGPQGTLKGVSAPSGAVTVTTARANPYEWEGYINTTATLDGDKNIEGALNIPVIEDILGVRIAGMLEKNNSNEVQNIYTGDESEYEGSGYRFSFDFQPLDSLLIRGMHQVVKPEQHLYTALESAYLADDSLPAPNNPDIQAEDRRTVQDLADDKEDKLELSMLSIRWDITDQYQLNYVGAYRDETLKSQTLSDTTNVVDDTYPDILQGVRDNRVSDADSFSHEIRLQNSDPLFGKLDVLIGGLYQNTKNDLELYRPRLYEFLPDSPTYAGTGIPGEPAASYLYIYRNTPEDNIEPHQTETSFFANLTYYVTDNTELSLGARKIKFEKEERIRVETGTVDFSLFEDTSEDEDTTYLASIKHNFTDDLSTYFTWGTSWRFGPTPIGESTPEEVRGPVMTSFLFLPPETSESFELGIKSQWFDRRLTVNSDIYFQEFENYAFRPGIDIWYLGASQANADNIKAVNTDLFVAPVPVEVYGYELDINYLILENLSIGTLLSYTHSEIQDGVVPCNDYLPYDGLPDESGLIPSDHQIELAANGENLTTCISSQASTFATPFSMSTRAEYSFSIGGNIDAFVRGLWSYYDETINNPLNDVDDIDDYHIVNFYTGIRGMDGDWEVMLYVKNIGDVVKVINRDDPVNTTNLNDEDIAGDYRQVSLTAERETGITLRYNF